jgi:hypothetical protein
MGGGVRDPKQATKRGSDKLSPKFLRGHFTRAEGETNTACRNG